NGPSDPRAASTVATQTLSPPLALASPSATTAADRISLTEVPVTGKELIPELIVTGSRSESLNVIALSTSSARSCSIAGSRSVVDAPLATTRNSSGPYRPQTQPGSTTVERARVNSNNTWSPASWP